MRSRIVLDSSVVNKWFIKDQEDGLDQAESLLQKILLGDFDCFVPDLLCYEVGNTLLRRGTSPVAELARLNEDLSRIPFFFAPLSKYLLGETFGMASRCGITFYDALFAAVADRFKATLITADKKLAQRVSADISVTLLMEWRS